MAPIKLLTINDHPVMSVKTIGTYRERLKTKLGLDTARRLERFAAEGVAANLAPRAATAP